MYNIWQYNQLLLTVSIISPLFMPHSSVSMPGHSSSFLLSSWIVWPPRRLEPVPAQIISWHACVEIVIRYWTSLNINLSFRALTFVIGECLPLICTASYFSCTK